MDNEKVDQAFQALHDAQRAARLLYMDLRDASDMANAEKAKLRADRLQNEIDNLLNRELSDWQAGADALIPQLNQAADAAQKAVAEIEKDVQNAQKIADGLKTLDEAIGVAIKFIG